MINPHSIDWEKLGGLVPAIVQDARDGSVLMLGYMNREALDLTLSSGRLTFYSRSRQRLWTKGETSGNFLLLKSGELDCDADSLLFQVLPEGPTCHTGSETCWGSRREVPFLGKLDQIIAERYEKRPENSYTSQLFRSGPLRMGQKVGEEGVEVAIAAQYPDQEALLSEAADLLFHLLVLLRSRGLGLGDLEKTLAARHS